MCSFVLEWIVESLCFLGVDEVEIIIVLNNISVYVELFGVVEKVGVVFEVVLEKLELK